MTGRRAGARSMLTAIVVLVAAVLALDACGVREDDEPRALAADIIPAELSESAPASSVPANETTTQRIYVVEAGADSQEHLAGLRVLIPKPSDPDTFPREVLDALVRLQPGENQSFINAIPRTTEILDVRRVAEPDSTEQDVLEINLNSLNADNVRLKQAVAQLVFTATEIPGIRGVRFLINGDPAVVPLDVGESGRGAVVTKSDFPQTNPEAPTTTTTTQAEPAEPVPVEPAPSEGG